MNRKMLQYQRLNFLLIYVMFGVTATQNEWYVMLVFLAVGFAFAWMIESNEGEEK